MPQPIPPGKTISFDFRRDAVLQRPLLAAYVTAVSTHWSEIESRLAVFLAALMGGEAKTIIRVFLAIQNDGARKAVLDSVTSLKLDALRLKEFTEIQEDIGRRYAERNKAVHGSWGISPEYPDCLLWYDPRTSIAMFPELMERIDPSKLAERRHIVDEQQKNLRIFTEQDLKDILIRMNETYGKLESFTAPFVVPLFAGMTV